MPQAGCHRLRGDSCELTRAAGGEPIQGRPVRHRHRNLALSLCNGQAIGRLLVGHVHLTFELSMMHGDRELASLLLCDDFIDAPSELSSSVQLADRNSIADRRVGGRQDRCNAIEMAPVIAICCQLATLCSSIADGILVQPRTAICSFQHRGQAAEPIVFQRNSVRLITFIM